VVRPWVDTSRGLSALVHNDAAHRMKLLSVERLCEEVRYIVEGAHKGHLDLQGLDHVTHEEVAPCHVLHAIMVLRVVRHVASALAVRRERRRAGLGAADAGK